MRAIYWPTSLNVHYICQCSALCLFNYVVLQLFGSVFYCCCISGFCLWSAMSGSNTFFFCMNGWQINFVVNILGKYFLTCSLNQTCVTNDNSISGLNILHRPVTELWHELTVFITFFSLNRFFDLTVKYHPPGGTKWNVRVWIRKGIKFRLPGTILHNFMAIHVKVVWIF